MARESVPKLHGANVLSGLGRAAAFTRNAILPRSPQPQRRESRVGQCLHKITDSRNGLWISAIDLSGRVEREFRNVFLERYLSKLNIAGLKHVSLGGGGDFRRQLSHPAVMKLFFTQKENMLVKLRVALCFYINQCVSFFLNPMSVLWNCCRPSFLQLHNLTEVEMLFVVNGVFPG